MKILLIGDPHFKENNAYESNQFIEEIYKLLEKVNYDKIIILGDILDSHEKISLRSLCKSIDFIYKLSEKSKIYLLIGNHDRINNAVFLTEEHPFTALKNQKNIVVVDKVIKEENFIYVPYVPTGMFKKALETIEYNIKKIKIIFAHQEFKNSIFKDQGDIPPEGPLIYSGHIHNYKKLDNVTYVGTPFQHSFYDNPDKFVMQLNIDDEKIREEKIYLNIIKKRIKEININELEDYKVDKNFLTKLVINGDRKLLESKKAQEILKNPNISYKLNYQKKETNKKKEEVFSDFDQLLEKRLEAEDKQIKILYQKLKQKLK